MAYLGRDGSDYVSLSRSSVPTADSAYDIGSATLKYNQIFANTFNGTATSAEAFQSPMSITLSGDQNGVVSFDGSSNVTLTTSNVPANLLSDLLTVDGAGSGLDSDLLDGQEGSYYLDVNSVIDGGSF